ncbi:helix-turn-helix transcriptional regulator [Bacillus sp. ISL-53]|uniref:helix-turn-helix domain-containing protein n=1 Tax=unclassified Bacillus (in: firmicutes) TaxID=185979 RepID=UPI001BE601FC|nr:MULTISPECIES: XRE family transcriptional regulator [unclassified Bacillus (in: firmicutes)]MBT2605220.1 helix-turn-helix transcriptional regulator [Bacillus sp. ISL-53]MBT2613885.1 helix-turn-helix transcriptional regulator [Bacillus sp. ISL-78]MBT2627764.1 helix-turn-helix transcriptional regulator [Bacillus sp. ISL-101]
MKEENIDLSSHVGLNLREIRRNKRISLEELASLSNVSKLTLGKIERGETNPTVNILWKICRGLNIPLVSLLTFEEDIKVHRFVSNYHFVGHNDDWFIDPLFKAFGTEWYRACIEPNSEYSELHLAGSEEIVLVLNGQLEIRVGGKTHQLNKWDAIKFKGEEFHTYINRSNEKVYLMLALAYKTP